MIENWFTTILNMGITASYVALVVIGVRLLLRKVPKVFSYILWLPVWIRLISPVSFHSDFSFFNFLKSISQTNTHGIEYIPHDIGMMKEPTVDVGINAINRVINSSLPKTTPIASVNSMQIIIGIASMIWILGIGILLVYSISSYIKIAINIRTATLVKDNIFETDRITTPFVWGITKPRIYIPIGLSEDEFTHVLAHEQIHIKRRDNIAKPLAFIILVIHWFNPIIWLSFILMSRDMEMSCDESVIKQMGNSNKKSYSNSLLSLSVKRSGLLIGSPLAFGESNTKSRIKNILNYKKPTFWVMICTIVIMSGLLLSLMANPKNDYKIEDYFGYDIETLIENQTPYVGNNSKVVALIDAMPLPEGIVRDSVELQTTKEPYGITINYHMNDSSTIAIKGSVRDISGEFFERNAVVLFSLIDNMNVITGTIVGQTGEYDGASYSFQATREIAGQFMDEDVRIYAKNTDTLRNLIERVANTSFLTMPVSNSEEKQEESEKK